MISTEISWGYYDLFSNGDAGPWLLFDQVTASSGPYYQGNRNQFISGKYKNRRGAVARGGEITGNQ